MAPKFEQYKDNELLEIVKEIEGEDKSQRAMALDGYLLGIDSQNKHIDSTTQKYSSGENIIWTIGNPPHIGIGSHYDVVPNSPGANDNASAMAVTIDVIRKILENPLKNIGLKGFFFDEEEYGLKGSREYIKEFGIKDLIGVYNMELVGSGTNLAFWAANNLYEGKLLTTIENQAKSKGFPNYRFPQISRFLMNSGDHESFIRAGLNESFCITTVSEEDIELGEKYGLISNQPPTKKITGLARLLTSPPTPKTLLSSSLFKHYHQPTDTSDHLDNETLKMVSDLLFNSILEIDKNY